MAHVYMGIENIALTNPQRATLVTALQSLGPIEAANPSHRNHWRVRTDNNAVIFEALFGDNDLTVNAVKGYLANVFSVPVGDVSHVLTDTAYGPLLTLSYAATSRLRVILFGGATPTYAESWE
jgi:hypothetical protein